jgi:hypothetical protein
MTDDQLKADLIHLAVDRTIKAVGSVLQLTDDPATEYSILISVAANAINEAAKVLARENRVSSRDGAVGHIFKEILDAYGLDWRRPKKKVAP